MAQQMRKVKKSPKNLFPTLLLTALLGLIAPKFFPNDVAASTINPLIFDYAPQTSIDPQTLAGDGQFLGAYRVVKINSAKGYVGDLCQAQKESHADCDQVVWAYAKLNKLILIKAPTADDIQKDSVSVFSLDGNCKTQGNLGEAQADGIFSLSLCNASGPDTNATDATGSTIMGGTIGFSASAGDQSPNAPAYTTLALPSTTEQGDIKISSADHSISIHKSIKGHRGFWVSTTESDNTTVLEPIKATQ